MTEQPFLIWTNMFEICSYVLSKVPSKHDSCNKTQKWRSVCIWVGVLSELFWLQGYEFYVTTKHALRQNSSLFPEKQFLNHPTAAIVRSTFLIKF